MSKVATPFDSFNIESLKLGPIKVSKAASGCKTAKIQAGGRDVLIQTPPMTIPWDIIAKKMDEHSNPGANLSLSFTGIDETDDNEDLNKFMKFMKAFDVKVKVLIAQTDGALGKKSEEKVLGPNFKDSIKESSNGDYPPTIQPKIWLNLKDGGDPKCVEDYTMGVTVFNFKSEEISCAELKKGCHAAAIFKPSYVWCSALGVGITWVAEQVAVQPITVEKFGFTLGKSFDKFKEEVAASPNPPAKRAKTDGSSGGDDDEDTGSQGSSRDGCDEHAEQEVEF